MPMFSVRFGRTFHLSCTYPAQVLWVNWRRLVAPGTKPDVVLVTLKVCAALLTMPARFAYRLFAVVRCAERMPGRSAAVKPFVFAELMPNVNVGTIPPSLNGLACSSCAWKPNAISCLPFSQVALSCMEYVFTSRP